MIKNSVVNNIKIQKKIKAVGYVLLVFSFLALFWPTTLMIISAISKKIPLSILLETFVNDIGMVLLVVFFMSLLIISIGLLRFSNIARITLIVISLLVLIKEFYYGIITKIDVLYLSVMVFDIVLSLFLIIFFTRKNVVETFKQLHNSESP